MARIETPAFRYKVSQPVGPTHRAYRYTLPATEPVLNDEYDFFKVQGRPDFKVLDAGMASDRLDSGGAPTLTVDLILTDDTTTHTLVSGWTGARDATAANRIVRCELPDAFGLVLSDGPWRLALKWSAAAETYVASKVVAVWFSFDVSDVSSGA